MADIERLKEALIAADAAGNTDDAMAFADAIRAAQKASSPPTPTPSPADAAPITNEGASLSERASQVLEGATMGWGDEGLGALYGAYRSLKDDLPFMPSVNRGIDSVRQVQQQAAQKMGPAQTLGMQALGGLSTLGLGGGVKGAQMLGKGVSTLGKLGQAAKVGAGTGAIAGAGMSEGGFTPDGLIDRATGAGMGAATGALLSPALTGSGMVGKSVLDYGRRLIPGGAKKQAQGLARSTITPAQAVQMQADDAAMPSVSVLGDVAPRDARRMAGESLRRVGGGEAADQIEARHSGQVSRIIPKVDEIISNKPYWDTVNDLGQKRALSAKANYGDAYSQQLQDSPRIREILNNPAMKDIYEDAKEISRIMDADFPADWEDAKLLPTVELMDFMKQALDDKVETAFRGGSGKLGSALKSLRQKLKDEVDLQVPDYAKARSEYAGYSAALEAADQGKKFMRALNDETGAEDFGSIIKDMGDHEAEAFRAGAASVLRDKVRAKGSWTDVVSAGDATQPFKTLLFKDKLEKMLGPEDAKRFLDGIEQEMKMSRLAMELKGSQTAQREMAGGAMDSAAQVTSEATRAKFGDPAAVMQILSRATDFINAPSSAVSKEFNDLLLSSDPVKKAAALNMLQRPTTPLQQLGPASRGALNVAGGYAGGGMQAQDPYLLKPGY